ncbi:MAG: hypothetical protein R3F54_32180 [Alphaproteobacteria bacterium]
MKVLPILPLLTILAGCISADKIWSTAPPQEKTVPVDVEIFSKLPPWPPIKTVKIIPINEKRGSIEYEIYGDHVKDGFKSIGWDVVEDDTKAEYVAIFDYVTDGGVDHVETDVVPQFGQTGVSSARTSGYVGPYGNYNSTTTFTPTFGITGTREIKRLVTRYGHAVSVSMYHQKGDDIENVFFGISSKSTEQHQRRKLIEYMFKAVFLNFDKNGEDIVAVPTGEFINVCNFWC